MRSTCDIQKDIDRLKEELNAMEKEMQDASQHVPFLRTGYYRDGSRRIFINDGLTVFVYDISGDQANKWYASEEKDALKLNLYSDVITLLEDHPDHAC